MSTVRVQQFVPTFEPGAVGHHILAVQDVLRAHGIGGEVFAEHVHPGMTEQARSYRAYGATVPALPGDVLLYHIAIGSVVADFVAARPERLAVWHHNITPVDYLRPWEPRAGPGITWGRRQLVDLAARASLAIADSTFNCSELADAGYADPVVVPILLDVESSIGSPDPVAERRLRGERTGGAPVVLFVGRLAPNKCQHDLIKVLAALRAGPEPDARLRLVGGAELESYADAIRRLAYELQVGEAVDITGSVGAAVLAAHYATADVFLSLSEHEGFCVPLLEAMAHDLPVVAYEAGAVAETLGGSGVLLPAKDPALVAAAVARVVHDGALRTQLSAAGRDRVAAFSPDRVGARLLSVLQQHGVIAGAAP
jgi:glycosyltransferase involved in cell wall biosynthesis